MAFEFNENVAYAFGTEKSLEPKKVYLNNRLSQIWNFKIAAHQLLSNIVSCTDTFINAYSSKLILLFTFLSRGKPLGHRLFNSTAIR